MKLQRGAAVPSRWARDQRPEFGAKTQNRTGDPLLTRQPLCRLSYLGDENFGRSRIRTGETSLRCSAWFKHAAFDRSANLPQLKQSQ